MLSASDLALDNAVPVFIASGVKYSLLVPTKTGYEKSIMDATELVRDFLKDTGVHSYENQKQGPENKARIKSYFVKDNALEPTFASLYRPTTKCGDPRIWFDGLKKYCSPYNLLALIVIDKEIYVFNLSNPAIFASLTENGFARTVIQRASDAGKKTNSIATELRKKILAIHKQGFLPSITPGDPGVGDTLENALGIKKNNSKKPDYQGIELKASRISRNGKDVDNRINLFARVPDEGMKYRQILENFGKVQIPSDRNEKKKKDEEKKPRLQLYDSTSATRPNAYGLMLNVNYETKKLELFHVNGQNKTPVSAWLISNLKDALKTKHKETFWVKAVAKKINGIEHFRYDKIIHTKEPNISMLVPMLATGKVTVDFTAHVDPNTKKARNHGLLFKVAPENVALMFGDLEIYDLSMDDV